MSNRIYGPNILATKRLKLNPWIGTQANQTVGRFSLASPWTYIHTNTTTNLVPSQHFVVSVSLKSPYIIILEESKKNILGIKNMSLFRTVSCEGHMLLN